MAFKSLIYTTGHNAWFVTGAAAVVFGGVISPMVVYGILFVDIANDLKTSAVQTGIVASVTWALCFLGSPVCEYLKGYVSNRSLVILGSTLASLALFASSSVNSFAGLIVVYGIVYGMASNLALHGVFCTLYQHFPVRNSATATGIALGGCTVGSLILTIMFEHLLPLGGWRIALKFNSLFTAVVAIPSSLLVFGPKVPVTMTNGGNNGNINNATAETIAPMREEYSDLTRTVDGDFKNNFPGDDQLEGGVQVTPTTGTWREVLGNPSSWLLFIAILLPTLSWSVYWINIVSYFDSLNIEGRCLSNLLMVLPIFEAIGKVGIGLLAEAIPKVYLLVAHNLFFLVVTATFAFFPVYNVLLICTMLIGAGRGSYNVLPYAVLAQLLPTSDSDKAVTVTMVALGVGFTLGTTPAGAIFDRTQSYTYALLLNIVFYVLGVLLLICAVILRSRSMRSSHPVN